MYKISIFLHYFSWCVFWARREICRSTLHKWVSCPVRQTFSSNLVDLDRLGTRNRANSTFFQEQLWLRPAKKQRLFSTVKCFIENIIKNLFWTLRVNLASFSFNNFNSLSVMIDLNVANCNIFNYNDILSEVCHYSCM